jgi:hypothetical protein
LPLANSISGDASLNTNHILHGRQEVDNQTQVPNDELQDIGTSPTAPGEMVTSEERPMLDNDAPSINRASPFHNERLVQTTDDRGPTHYVVLPSGVDGVDTEGNTPVPGVENINTLDAAPVSIREVATHLMPPSQPRQLFKLPANVSQRPVCIQPPMHPMFVVPDPSPPLGASNTVPSDDKFF